MRQVHYNGTEHARRDKFQNFRNKLEESFHNPSTAGKPDFKPVACKPLETPQLSHYNSLLNFHGSSEKRRPPRNTKNLSTGEDNPFHYKTTTPRRRAADIMFKSKDLPGLLPLDLLKQVRQHLKGDLRYLSASYKKELYLTCTELLDKLDLNKK